MENLCEQLQHGSAIIYLIVRERESRRTRCCRVTCRGPIGYRFAKYTCVSIVYRDFFLVNCRRFYAETEEVGNKETY